jgi:hypothetical protein
MPRMFCHLCHKPTNMTVRTNNGEPFNCCRECYDRQNGPVLENGKRDMRVWMSHIFKPEPKEEL